MHSAVSLLNEVSKSTCSAKKFAMTHPYKIIIPLSSFDGNLLPDPRVSTEDLPAAIHQFPSTTHILQDFDGRLLVGNE